MWGLGVDIFADWDDGDYGANFGPGKRYLGLLCLTWGYCHCDTESNYELFYEKRIWHSCNAFERMESVQ